MLIKEEEKKIYSIAGHSTGICDALVRMKERHQRAVEVLTKAIANKSMGDIPIETIYEYCAKLCALKHNGPLLKERVASALIPPNEEEQEIEEQKFDFSIVEATKSTDQKVKRDEAKATNKEDNVKTINIINAPERSNEKNTEAASKCLICNLDHSTADCGSHNAKLRESIVTLPILCSNCLETDHLESQCSNPRRCAKCGGKHHEVICAGNEPTSTGNAQNVDNDDDTASGNRKCANTTKGNCAARAPIIEILSDEDSDDE